MAPSASPDDLDEHSYVGEIVPAPSSGPIESMDTVVNALAIPVPATESKAKAQTLELTDQTNMLPFKKIVVVFISLSLCALVTSLDSLIVSASLPTVSAVFNAGAVSSWVPSAYLMTSTAFQPLYGRLSDIFGRKSTLCLAMSVYVIGNLGAGFSKSIIQVIVCRGIAGAGGGGITSMLQIIISDIISLRDRGKYVGASAGFISLGYTIGPILGGVLAETDWRWCFWVTLPLSVIATTVAMVFVPLKPVGGGILQKLMIIDYAGVVLTLVGCTLIMLPLIWGGVTFPWQSAIVLAPLCCGILTIAIFCVWEWKVAKLPIVPMHIFKHVTIAGVYICMFANGFVFFSALYYLPQFFEVVLGYSPTRSGIFLIPVVLSQVCATVSAGLSVSHTGKYRTVVYTGFSLSAIGCGCISTFTQHSSKATMVVLMLITGFGNGMTMQTTTVAAQASVARKDMSVVTAVRNFIRMLGGAISLPVSSSLLNNAISRSMLNLNLPPSTITNVINDPSHLRPSLISSVGISPTQASYILSAGYTKGFKDIFILNSTLSAVAVIVSMVMIKHKELLRGDEDRLRQEAALAHGGEKRSKEEPSEPLPGDTKHASDDKV